MISRRSQIDIDQIYTFRKLSHTTYVLDLPIIVREYLKQIGYGRKTMTHADVWVACVKATPRGGRWGKAVACGATEDAVRKLVA